MAKTKQWIVRFEGEAYEDYLVEAESEEDAMKNWMNGTSQGVYGMGMDVVKAWVDDPQDTALPLQRLTGGIMKNDWDEKTEEEIRRNGVLRVNL